jgi:hypothetical protein
MVRLYSPVLVLLGWAFTLAVASGPVMLQVAWLVLLAASTFDHIRCSTRRRNDTRRT